MQKSTILSVANTYMLKAVKVLTYYGRPM